jgi:transcriptional regulator with XRE-family HTH domain
MATRPYASLPFAIYFDEIIKSRGQSATQFAESVEINERLIRAWRTGERIPNFKNIEVLRKALEIPFDEIKDKLVESIRLGDEQKSKPASEHLLAVKKMETSLHSKHRELPIKITQNKINLNQALINLVQSLKTPSDDQNNRILIIFQSRDIVFEKEFLGEWKSSLKNTIKNGWTIEHIVQIDRARERNLRTISNILTYVSDEDQYQLYKLKHKKLVDVSSGMLIIPGVGAIICYATEHPDYIDKGIFLQQGEDDDQIQIYAKHFELMKQQSDPVFRKYDNTQQQEVLQALEELGKADQHPGERLVFLKRLSEVTRPLYFYDKDSNWAKAIQKYYNFTDEQLDNHLETRKQRHEVFRNTLRNDRCRYIYYLRTLNEFVSTGTTYPHYFQATEQERLDQLLEIRRLILSEDSNKNFEFALIHEDEEHILGDVKPSFCEVKKGVVTTMEVPTGTSDENGNLKHKWFVIEDATVTNAVVDYFSDIWDFLKDDSKGLSALLWLNQKINGLEDQLKLPRTGGG